MLLDSSDKEDSFILGSLFIATESKPGYNERAGTVSFDLNEVVSFSMVDRQHRSFGFDLALKEVEKYPKNIKKTLKR